MDLYKYRLWCETEVSSVYRWEDADDPVPTLCPNNTEHSIDTSQTVIVQRQIDQASATEDGCMMISAYYDSIEDAPFYQGMEFVCSGDTTTIADMLITADIKMYGGKMWSVSGVWGCFGNMQLIDKNDVLGFFDELDLEVGEDILEVHKFVDNCPLKPGEWDTAFQPPTISEVCSGLYVRITIDNVGIGDMYVGTSFLFYGE